MQLILLLKWKLKNTNFSGIIKQLVGNFSVNFIIDKDLLLFFQSFNHIFIGRSSRYVLKSKNAVLSKCCNK